MNPLRDSTGPANNSNNENEVNSPLSIESLEMLPLFPLVVGSEQEFLELFPQLATNLPQEGDNNNGPSTDVPLHENPNVASGSNIFPSSSLVATPQNPSAIVDLSLNLGIRHQRATIVSPAATPSTNVTTAHQVQVISDTVHLPTKRSYSDHASGEYAVGESSNMAEQAALAKRSEIDQSRVSANNGNPPPGPVVQQAHQFFSENERNEPIRGQQHVNSQNAGSVISSHNPHVNRFASTRRRLSQAPLPNQASLYQSGASQQSLQPLGFRSSSSLITRPPSIVNTISMRTAPRAILPRYPYTETDVLSRLHGQESTMFGQAGTSVGNFSTYRPIRSNDDSDNVFVGRSPYNFPQWFDSSPMQSLSGNVDDNVRVRNTRAITYHPLSDQAGPSTSRGSLGMNHSAASSSSGTRNYHNQVQISGSASPPFVRYEGPLRLPRFASPETRRRVPPEVQFILDYMRSTGRTILLEHMGNQEQLDDLLPPAGLSVETIMQHLEYETFVSVEIEDPEGKDRCPICLDDFEDGDEIGKLHSCVHKFHVHCINQWLVHRNSCPVCKRLALETNNANAGEP